jgi:hypothetical protein
MMELSEILQALNNLLNKQIPWYEEAEAICKTFLAMTKDTPGVHHKVYLVLLEGIDDEEPGYAVYVGLTGLTPEERFQNHKDGYRDSKIVKTYGKRLLPGLYTHLNPMSYKEAKQLESEIFQALKDAGIPAYGGH